MTPYYEREGIRIYVGDNRDILPHLDPNSISAVVTDPPYGLSFMGRDWDHEVPGVPFWHAIADTMKPGTHLLSFGGSRTFHRIAVAIEDAGYEIRDTLMWLYGSGFPKSHDVSKAIDKMAGAEREVISREVSRFTATGRNERYGKLDYFETDEKGREIREVTAPATHEAEQWQGWQTALKPAYEPVICARKPFKGNVAANVLQHGTGAINVDACRIGTDTVEAGRGGRSVRDTGIYGAYDGEDEKRTATGRWPANVLLDEESARLLDAQSGESQSRIGNPRKSAQPGIGYGMTHTGAEYNDTGGASRFLYVAKASRAERRRGLPDDMDANHPTVKPLALMEWLITLITPPGGVILDPFMGSGSTLVAAAELGFDAIGIELSEEYAEIAARRIDHAISEGRQPALPLGEFA